MGFFSWKTADSKESVLNVHSCHANAGKTVYLLQPNGQEPIAESAYNGYGMFGGLDAYAWLAKQNIDTDEVKALDLYEDSEQLRMMGIALASSEENIPYPIKLSFNKNAQYEQLAPSEDCEFQGFLR